MNSLYSTVSLLPDFICYFISKVHVQLIGKVRGCFNSE